MKYKIGDKVNWDGEAWTILVIEDRNTYEPLPGVKQIGNAVVLQDLAGNRIVQVYDFDL